MVTILVIGRNEGQFGLGHKDTVLCLTNLNKFHGNKCIANVYSGNRYSIYSDSNHKNIWVAGTNSYGECAVESIDSESTAINSITNLFKLDYFAKNNINIKQIFARFTGERTFWLTTNNFVYGNGKGYSAEPILIPLLTDAVDIQSAYKYSIALCSTDKNISYMILESWSRSLFINNIPNEIIDLIAIFYHTNHVYSTNGFGNGETKGFIDDPDTEYMDELKAQIEWKMIETLKDKDIVKISTGRRHSLFLDSSGNVWSCGLNEYGELGIVDEKHEEEHDEEQYIPIPTKMKWFVEHNIKIISISCGGYHNLALDTNHRVYGWGFNDDGECGMHPFGNISVPRLINDLKAYKIEYICAGFWHSYCGTVDGKHFLFGENDYHQCIVDGEEDEFEEWEVVVEPACINQIIETQFPNKTIQYVLLGNDCTTLILSDNNQ